MPPLKRPAASAAADGIELLLFDVGGVLVQIGGVEPFLRELKSDLSLPEFWRRWLYSPSVRAFETGRMQPLAFARALLAEFDWHCDPQAFEAAFTQWPTGVFAGVDALLRDLPARCQRALLSNSNVLHWPRIMDGMGLGRSFPQAFASHLTGYIKPDAQAFTHVLQALSLQPQQVLFFDDNAPNVEAARSLGLQAELTRGPQQVRAVLEQRGLLTR